MTTYYMCNSLHVDSTLNREQLSHKFSMATGPVEPNSERSDKNNFQYFEH